MATEHLLAAPIAGIDLAIRNDCIGAFQKEFDYLCRTLRRLGIPTSDIGWLEVEDVALEYSRLRKELEGAVRATRKRAPT